MVHDEGGFDEAGDASRPFEVAEVRLDGAYQQAALAAPARPQRLRECLNFDRVTENRPRTVRLDGDSVVISHVYVERRVVPLDVYVREAARPAASDAVVDFGQSIKDMASTNIFPGDLLLKNFGVTRHGRVVFYDYDELRALTEIRFRRLPEPRNGVEELGEEPWFPVGDDDVFPEEHQAFLGLPPDLRQVFMDHHADLFDVEAWQAIQDRLELGELIEVFPYRQDARLPGTGESRGW